MSTKEGQDTTDDGPQTIEQKAATGAPSRRRKSVETEAEPEVEENPAAQAYLDNLLNDGCLEGDSGAKMEMPEWYNESLFAQGQTYMSKYRFVVTSGMLSGLIAVLAIPSILRVLMCTGQSSTAKTAYRRYVRTILHTNAWYDYSPKEKDSKFWTSLRAVRRAHSRSSYASSHLGGGKITQKDLALTQFGFIGFITLGAPRIQLYDEDFLEGTSHMWRVVGYLLGLKDEYNICGRNWAETKSRLDIVMRKVYAPALENTGEDFEKMTKALINGLWPLNTMLTAGSFLFFTKRLSYVRGYEYYEFDHRAGSVPDRSQKCFYKDLNLYDRFLVSYGLFLVTYLHKYNVVRWYLNFRTWLNQILMQYVPYIAVWLYGIKWAYVRIFTENGASEAYDFNLKDD